MNALESITLRAALSLAVAVASSAAFSQTVSEAAIRDRLVNGPWQVGLYGDARHIPAGLAFKRGITAAVFTFGADGRMRANVPCRNEEFLRSVGGDFQIEGTWTLDEDQLQNTITLGGYSKTEKYLVSFNGSDLELRDVGGKLVRLGRFFGNLQETCTFE